ncbi:hypothetical protein RvY_09583 [Ramazzottius varieornatus]|uniref:Sm domain-containing protein n=1 Tax=Ramazzottius varieornatus TaxID=947166 RepID=A0A1D1V9X2_RAMVA|nr:hypothetical protein RvY_09583 [Ramazzottius varieornatus]
MESPPEVDAEVDETRRIDHKQKEPASTSPFNFSAATSPGRTEIQKLFNKEFKLILKDDRVVIGTFFCTDKDANIVLGGAREYENDAEFTSRKKEPRFVGLVMVNIKNLKALFVDTKEVQTPTY